MLSVSFFTTCKNYTNGAKIDFSLKIQGFSKESQVFSNYRVLNFFVSKRLLKILYKHFVLFLKTSCFTLCHCFN